jgi:hypothetical protein
MNGRDKFRDLVKEDITETWQYPEGPPNRTRETESMDRLTVFNFTSYVWSAHIQTMDENGT